ncbi:MAG: hypothetical protein ACYDG2_20175, partial [Ruminiclostridium sp.]
VEEYKRYGMQVVEPGAKFWGGIDNYANLDTFNTFDGSNTGVTNHNGASIGTVNTGTDSKTEINNSGYIRTINTGDNSNTTVNNRSIIDTLNTGKNSSLVLNNSGQITNVKIGENGTAEINNYYYIKKITGGDITDDSKKGKIGMNISNSGYIGEIHTGAYSENEVDTLNGHIDWLETGLNNGTKVSGANKITKSDGNGTTLYKLFSSDGKTSKWVDNINTQDIARDIASGLWSFSPPKTIVVNGKEYIIYVPQYANGTNSLDSNGWITVNTIQEEIPYTNRLNAVIEFFSGIGNNMINTTAEGTVTKIQQNTITYKNGSDKGILTLDSSNEMFSGGFGMLIDMIIGATNSIKNNKTKIFVKTILQENGNERRAVIEIGNTKSPTSNNSGSYYVINQDNIDNWGYQQGFLNSALEENGLEKYEYFWRDSDIKVNIDKQHNTNKYSSYMGFDNQGNMTLTPILYKGDNIQLVNFNYFEGIWWDEKVDLTFNPSNLAKPIPFPNSSSEKLESIIEDNMNIDFK